MSKPDEISRETTLRVRDACLCLHTQRAARALARRFDRAFAHLGMTNGQFSLMMSLNRPEPPALGQIARLLAMDRTSLTAMLKPLERRGWVEVRVDPADRRSRRPALTDQGRAALARGLAVWEAEHAALEAELADPQALRDGLNALAFGPAPDPSTSGEEGARPPTGVTPAQVGVSRGSSRRFPHARE